MALNALLKTKERHSHRQWILNWLEDNYECKKGATICKAAVFSDYAEVCRLQTLKPVTNSLFGKLVKAVFPAIRTCRKGPRSDSRTHYAGLHRRRDTISLPRVCPETGEILPHEEGASGVMSFIPAPSSSSSGIVESIPLHSDCSLTSSSPSSPTVSLEMSPVMNIVEASGSLPAFHFGQPHHQQQQHQQQHHSLGDLHCSQFVDSVSFGLQQHHHHSADQLAAVSHQLSFYSPAPSLSSCSSGASTYDDALSEFEEMDLGDAPSLGFGSGSGSGGADDSFHDFAQLPMPMAPPCLCPSCGDADTSDRHGNHSYGSSSLEAVDDVLGDLEPHLLNLDPSMLHHLTSASATDHHSQNHSFGFGSSEECCGYGQVPAVPMASSMMAPPVAPSPPASPPPPLALMASPEFGCGGAAHHPHTNSKLRPFLRRTMAMAAAKTSAQAAEGNPLAEGLMGMISTCQKIIKDRAQKRRRKSIGDSNNQQHQHQHLHQNVKHEPHLHFQQQQQQHQHVVKKQHALPSVEVDANALVPPFVLSLEEIPGSQASFGFQESVLVFANEYRKMYQAVFDRLVRFEYAILFDVVFSFWNQVKLQPNFSFLLDHEPVKKQLLAYDKKVLHTFKDYFTMNPLKMSAPQFGGFLQTIAFHLPFSAERATLPLLPTDLFDEKMRLLQTFAADLQGQAQSFTLPHLTLQQQQQHTIMEINNY